MSGKEIANLRDNVIGNVFRKGVTGRNYNNEPLPFNFLDSHPSAFGKSHESNNIKKYMKNYTQAKRLIEGSGTNVIAGAEVEKLVKKLAADEEVEEGLRFKHFVSQSMFSDPSITGEHTDRDYVRKWDTRHKSFNWKRYKAMFPEFLVDTFNRAKMTLELNAMFAKMAVFVQPQSKEDFMLLYLYEQDKAKPYEFEIYPGVFIASFLITKELLKKMVFKKETDDEEKKDDDEELIMTDDEFKAKIEELKEEVLGKKISIQENDEAIEGLDSDTDSSQILDLRQRNAALYEDIDNIKKHIELARNILEERRARGDSKTQLDFEPFKLESLFKSDYTDDDLTKLDELIKGLTQINDAVEEDEEFPEDEDKKDKKKKQKRQKEHNKVIDDSEESLWPKLLVDKEWFYKSFSPGIVRTSEIRSLVDMTIVIPELMGLNLKKKKKTKSSYIDYTNHRNRQKLDLTPNLTLTHKPLSYDHKRLFKHELNKGMGNKSHTNMISTRYNAGEAAINYRTIDSDQFAKESGYSKNQSKLKKKIIKFI